MKILSWNVNGIRAAYKKGLLEWIREQAPDMLCLQETKAAEDQIPAGLREIEGYRSYFSVADRKGYSGVALFTRAEPRRVEITFGRKKIAHEGRILAATYDDFVLFNIYFPNGKSSDERLRYKMQFYDAFLEHADQRRKKGERIIVCGDVNTAHREIDLARPRENARVSGFLPEERAWIDRLISHGYVDTFRALHPDLQQYSWWDMKSGARKRNVGWRIDYFFVSDDLKKRVKSAFIMGDIMGSDHCPVGIEIG